VSFPLLYLTRTTVPTSAPTPFHPPVAQRRPLSLPPHRRPGPKGLYLFQPIIDRCEVPPGSVCRSAKWNTHRCLCEILNAEHDAVMTEELFAHTQQEYHPHRSHSLLGAARIGSSAISFSVARPSPQVYSSLPRAALHARCVSPIFRRCAARFRSSILHAPNSHLRRACLVGRGAMRGGCDGCLLR
jgi:hypothetical protein